MDKNLFLRTLRTRLVEMNLPKETVNKHLDAFIKLFDGKSPQQIDTIIKSVGGPEGAYKGIYNLEMKKLDNRISANIAKSEPEDRNSDKNEEQSEIAVEVDSKAFEEAEEEEKRQNTQEPILNSGKSAESENSEPSPDSTMVRTKPIEETVPDSDAFLEYPVEVPDIYTRFTNKVWGIKENAEKKGDNKYKIYTALIDIAALPLILALFLVIVVLALTFFLGFIAVIAGGIALSIACIIYGLLQLSKSKAIATYEIGLGILVFGIAILVSTLLYNGFKRLSPFLFKHWKKLFRTFFDVNKIVFSKMKGV